MGGRGYIGSALLFGLFVTLRILLSGNADAAVQATATLHPDDKMALKRRVFVRHRHRHRRPPTSQVARLRRSCRTGSAAS